MWKDGRTNRQTDVTKLPVAFRSIANVNEGHNLLVQNCHFRGPLGCFMRTAVTFVNNWVCMYVCMYVCTFVL
jgi:hypothetical protein